MKNSRDKSNLLVNGTKKRAVKSRNNSMHSLVTLNGNENQKDTDLEKEEKEKPR